MHLKETSIKMPELAKKKCTPCEEKTGKLETTEAKHLVEELDRWKIVEDKHIEKLCNLKILQARLLL